MSRTLYFISFTFRCCKQVILFKMRTQFIVISFATKHKTQGYKEHEYNWGDCLFTQSVFVLLFSTKSIVYIVWIGLLQMVFCRESNKGTNKHLPQWKALKESLNQRLSVFMFKYVSKTMKEMQCDFLIKALLSDFLMNPISWLLILLLFKINYWSKQ